LALGDLEYSVQAIWATFMFFLCVLFGAWRSKFTFTYCMDWIFYHMSSQKKMTDD